MIDPMVFLECSHSKDLKTTFEYFTYSRKYFRKKNNVLCISYVHGTFYFPEFKRHVLQKITFFYVSCILTYKGHKHVSIFYTCLLYGCLVPPYALMGTFWVFFGDVSIVSYATNVHSFLEQYF